jgi:hypothetical protein
MSQHFFACVTCFLTIAIEDQHGIRHKVQMLQRKKSFAQKLPLSFTTVIAPIYNSAQN